MSNEEHSALEALIVRERRELRAPPGSVDACIASIRVSGSKREPQSRAQIVDNDDRAPVQLGFRAGECHSATRKPTKIVLSSTLAIAIAGVTLLVFHLDSASKAPAPKPSTTGHASTSDLAQSAMKAPRNTNAPTSPEAARQRARQDVERTRPQRSKQSLASNARRSPPNASVHAVQDGVPPPSNSVYSGHPSGNFDRPTPEREGRRETSTPVPDVDSSTHQPGAFAAEMQLIRSARQAIAKGRYKAARRSISNHIARFPRGIFSEDRDYLAVLISCHDGRPSANGMTPEQFIGHYPDSAHETDFIVACGERVAP